MKKPISRNSRSFLLQASFIQTIINASDKPTGAAIAFVMDRFQIKDPAKAYEKAASLRPLGDLDALMLVPTQIDEHGTRFRARQRLIQSPDLRLRSALNGHVMAGFRDQRALDRELRRAHSAPFWPPVDQRRNTTLDKGRVLSSANLVAA